MTDTTTTAAVRTAKDDLRAAETRLSQLIEERNQVEHDLQEASVLAVRQKAQAARAGDPVVASADLDAEQLRQRRTDLPYELYAQDVYVEECRLALYDAQDRDRQARYEEAEAIFAEVQPRFEAVKKEYEEARANRVDPTRNSHSAYLRKLTEATIRDLEATPPAAGEDHSPGAARDRVLQARVA